MTFGKDEAFRVGLVLIGIALIVAAMVSPWWTRGLSFEYGDGSDGEPATFEERGPPERFIPGLDQAAVSYGPFSTPGAGGFTTDASRATAVAVLGIATLLAGLMASASVSSRLLMRVGRIEVDHDAPVRFAIAAFLLGVFAIVWAGLFLPLLGQNPGWLYGTEINVEAAFGASDARWIEDVRYANVGFFLGILAFVAYPAWLWSDAALARSVAQGHRQEQASPAAAY